MDRQSIIKLAEILKVRTGSARGANIAFQCPLAPLSGEHASDFDKNPSFHIKVDDTKASLCNCMGCGRSGTLLGWFRRANRDFGVFETALEFILANEVTESLAKALENIGRNGKEEKAQTLTVHRVVRAARTIYPEALLERGLTDSDIKNWELGTDIIKERYLFPVWDYEKKLVGAVGRTYVDGLKYLSYDDFDAGEYLYGEHLVDSTKEEAVIVEGAIDTIMALRVLPNVLGLFGDKLTPVRKLKLKRWFDTVTLMMDGDAAGRVAEARIGSNLAMVVRLYVARLPWGFDPGNAGTRRIREAHKNRIFWGNLP